MMARITIEDFNDAQIARVYLAAGFAEAQSVEAELIKHEVDYAVEVEAYRGSVLLWYSEHKGAAFYVRESQANFCSELLRAAGLTAGLLDKDYQ
jgi:hypothetical protein